MLIKLYPTGNNPRILEPIIQALRSGEVIIYPTSTGYAYAADALQVRSVERICELKGINPRRKSLALMFENLSQISEYCKMNDRAFRFIKEHQGEYTFLLPVASSLPKIFKNRKEVGARLALHPIAKLLLEGLGNPILTSSLPLNKEDDRDCIKDPSLIHEHLGHQVYCVVDGGVVNGEPSTIVDCTKEPFEVVRIGAGYLDEYEPLLSW